MTMKEPSSQVLEGLLRTPTQLTHRQRCREDPDDWKCEDAEKIEIRRLGVVMKHGNIAGARMTTLFFPSCPIASLPNKFFSLR